MLLMGLLLSGFAARQVFTQPTFQVKAVMGAPAVLAMGIYATVIGRPIDPETGDVKQWAKIGLWVAGGLGLVVGVVFLVVLSV